MPRPHYPAQGGPHLPAWNTEAARKYRRPHLAVSPSSKQATPSQRASQRSAPVPSGQKATATATPLHRAANGNSVSATPPTSRQPLPKGRILMWLAAGVCVAALLFTMIVFVRHG